MARLVGSAIRRCPRALWWGAAQVVAVALATLLRRQRLGGKQRVAPHGRDGDAIKTGSCGGAGLKAPVAVPVFGEERGLFVRQALHGDHVPTARNRGDEGVVPELKVWCAPCDLPNFLALTHHVQLCSSFFFSLNDWIRETGCSDAEPANQR